MLQAIERRDATKSTNFKELILFYLWPGSLEIGPPGCRSMLPNWYGIVGRKSIIFEHTRIDFMQDRVNICVIRLPKDR